MDDFEFNISTTTSNQKTNKATSKPKISKEEYQKKKADKYKSNKSKDDKGNKSSFNKKDSRDNSKPKEFLNKKRKFNKEDTENNIETENIEPNNKSTKEGRNSYNKDDKKSYMTDIEKMRNKSHLNNINLINDEAEHLPNIEIIKESTYDPFSIKSFSDLKLNNFLLKQLEKNGYNNLTKIQKQAIPIMIEHKNVVVKSETGTGKTLAYVVPMYEMLLRQHQIKPISRKDGVFSIIFAPTHELCLQIESTIMKLSSCCINVVAGALLGGQKMDTEKAKIRKGVNIIICTPGRLLYHLKNTKSLNFEPLQMIIFDEADILLDMGFEKDIKECLKIVTEKSTRKDYEDIESFKKLKVFLLSATIDNRTRKLTSFIMKGYKSVGFQKDKDKKKDKTIDGNNINENEIEKENDDENKEELEHQNSGFDATVSTNLRQFSSIVYDEFRLIHLMSFLYTLKDKKTIVFLNNCESVDYHAEIISKININNVPLFSNKHTQIMKLHGKMKHTERLEIFNKFNMIKAPGTINNDTEQAKENKDLKLKENAIIDEEKKENDKKEEQDDSNNKKTKRKEKKEKKVLNCGAILLATDVIARGLDFPHVDWIIHYDINPNGKDYLNRIGRTARLTSSGNSLLFLMEHEEKLLSTCFGKFKLENLHSESILLKFVKQYNSDIDTKIGHNALEANFVKSKIRIDPMDWKQEIDKNEIYRKKYSFAIFPFIAGIKEFLYSSEEDKQEKQSQNILNPINKNPFMMTYKEKQEKENDKDRDRFKLKNEAVLFAKRAYRCTLRAYTTYRKYEPTIFNLNALHMTRFARAFGLYRESLKYKLDNEEYRIDQRFEHNKTKNERKFMNVQRKMEISEFI